MPADWFATWFDSPYYHLLYRHRDDTEAGYFLKNLLKYLNPGDDCHMADIPCGKGRHAIFLNRLGYKVTGLDLAANSIQLAQKFANERLKFGVHDMRQPYEKEQFDIILNLFTSLGYFDNEADNLKVFQSFHKALVPNGQLVVDFFNAAHVLKHLKTSDEKVVNSVHFSITKHIEGNRIIKTIQVKHMDREFTFYEKVQLITLSELKNWLASSGFEVTDLFGNYSLDSFDEATSERMIVKAIKK